MEEKKLQKIIEDHSLYLKSSGRDGKKAVLKDADLRNAELRETNLSGADLSGATLNNADLSDADLSKANLSGANLISADLSEADLSNANLSNSILRGANIAYANLAKAVLIRADLTNAALTSADLISANLANADLSNADLTYANMRNIILAGASLRNVDLIGTDLSGADLSGADLNSANLTDADLSNADISNADLSDTDLSNADLSNADLNNTDLSNSNMSNAVLFATVFRNTNMESVKISEKTILGSTIFANIDLSSVKNLQLATHLYPSTFGIDTIVKSNGIIDRKFLRDAGVQLNIISLIDSAIYAPIDYKACFISCSRGDENFAGKLHADLKAKKIRTWFPPEHIKIEDKFRETIHKNITVYDSLILILSKNSVKSDMVEKEVAAAMSKGKNEKSPELFIIKLDSSNFDENESLKEVLKKTKHIYDFSNWKNQVDYLNLIEKLLGDLKLTSE